MKIILNKKMNVYEQIVSEYKRYISLNILRYDEKLPSCRALATELGVNPNTVQRAYNVLEEEGFIRTIPKKGVYVSYNNEENDPVTNDLKNYFNELKKDNVSYQKIKSILDEIYGGEGKWLKLKIYQKVFQIKMY